MAPLRYAAKFDPFLSLDCAPTPSTLSQSKERKGSNFAIWQPCRDISAVDPSQWSPIANDCWCVAIVAGWGEIRMGVPCVKVRKREVAKWLNRHHGDKVGHLGLSRRGQPYHPNSDVFRYRKRPVFTRKLLSEV